MLVAFGFSWTAVATRPALAIYSVKLGLGRIGQPPPHGKPSTVLAATCWLVTINLYLVKRRMHGGFAADGNSVPTPLASFRLGRGQKWRASLWLSASCRWSCWPSQPRTGLANRCPGIVRDRTPLARVACWPHGANLQKVIEGREFNSDIRWGIQTRYRGNAVNVLGKGGFRIQNRFQFCGFGLNVPAALLLLASLAFRIA